MPLRGVVDPELNRMAKYRRTKTGKTGKNAARDFRRMVQNQGKVFPVTIKAPQVRIRQKVKLENGKRRIREVVTNYPVLHLSEWMRTILKESPHFILGGHDICSRGYGSMFEEFWEAFRHEDPHHPIFGKPTAQRRATIPFALHGDEGRGLDKTPVLILSFQVVIPYTGPSKLNSSTHFGLCWYNVFFVFKLRNVEDNWGLLHTGILRHSFSTRLLYSVLPSQWYAKNDASIDQLHDSMATDFCKVFEEGISVDAPGLLCNISMAPYFPLGPYIPKNVCPEPTSEIFVNSCRSGRGHWANDFLGSPSRSKRRLAMGQESLSPSIRVPVPSKVPPLPVKCHLIGILT